jgi:tetratricopeptide (TPR) repeat protein
VELCHEFFKHLSQLQRDGLVKGWHDRAISAGTDWAGKIDERLNTARIIVLLVSPDFLASYYCNDVEMTRALERHDRGEARVVPVILRPSDWKTSRFAKLSALPGDGKPVVDWKTHDHGFLNVVEGLRRLAEELRQPGESTAASVAIHRGRLRKSSSWQVVIAALILALLLTAGWFWRARQKQRFEQERQYVAQGEGLLNVGRYNDAREPYRQALRLNPENTQASLGLKLIDLDRLRSDPVVFERQLNQLKMESPGTSHLKVLEGDYLLIANRPDEAMSRYQEAAKLNPHLAEAYFRLGVLYDQQRRFGLSLKMYQRAVELSPSSPHYLDNLGDQYFKRGEYDRAIREYGRLDRFPLGALESAKIYRLMGELGRAHELELIANQWLEQDLVASLPENQWPWYFEISQTQGVTLATLDEKRCYARLALSATLYLRGEDAGAVEKSRRAAQVCGARSLDIKAILRWELERLAEERDELAARTESYRRKFLTE